MKAYCLASSSQGNCFVLDFEIKGCHNLIMIECGIPITQIYKKCNEFKINLADVKACLITHAHNDHTSGLKVLLKHSDFKIYANKDIIKESISISIDSSNNFNFIQKEYLKFIISFF